MYHVLLSDPSFYLSLLVIDKQIAEQYQQAGCPFCQGNLNQAHYERNPLGLPSGLPSDYRIRLSYCCSQDGCRKRCTPPSLRFLSRKQYSSLVILLIFMLNCSSDESRIERLNHQINTNLSVETLRRWRKYWLKKVPLSKTFKRSALIQSVAEKLPMSLLKQFQGEVMNQVKKA